MNEERQTDRAVFYDSILYRDIYRIGNYEKLQKRMELFTEPFDGSIERTNIIYRKGFPNDETCKLTKIGLRTVFSDEDAATLYTHLYYGRSGVEYLHGYPAATLLCLGAGLFLENGHKADIGPICGQDNRGNYGNLDHTLGGAYSELTLPKPIHIPARQSFHIALNLDEAFVESGNELIARVYQGDKDAYFKIQVFLFGEHTHEAY